MNERIAIRLAIARAGGVYRIAASTGIHYTQLYAWLRGECGLGPAKLAALRAALPPLPDRVWLAALGLTAEPPDGGKLVAPPEPGGEP